MSLRFISIYFSSLCQSSSLDGAQLKQAMNFRVEEGISDLSDYNSKLLLHMAIVKSRVMVGSLEWPKAHNSNIQLKNWWKFPGYIDLFLAYSS